MDLMSVVRAWTWTRNLQHPNHYIEFVPPAAQKENTADL